MSLDDISEINRIASMMNKRGHAHLFARETAVDKHINEHIVFQEWCEAMLAEFGKKIELVQQGFDSAPDFFAKCEGRKISVELTELVNSEILEQVARTRKAGERATAVSMFDAAQWTKPLFEERIITLLDSKHKKYMRREPSLVMDALVIYTDEDWLSPFNVSEWLNNIRIDPRSSFNSVYLVQTYFPGYAEHWPLFKLCGHL